MVPVGGSVIYSHKKHDLIEKINNFYPGRASNGPIMDLFLTFLEMGQVTLKSLIKERKENYDYLKNQLTEAMSFYGERCLETKNNKISVATTLTALHLKVFEPHGISPTFFGSYLFSRRVSGVRVVYTSKSKIND
jgi:O-phospho-L-seryl-tRNASec:L-selenocysteinyl-tRNA synthase